MKPDNKVSLRDRLKLAEGECERLSRAMRIQFLQAKHVIETQGKQLSILGTTLDMIADDSNWQEREDVEPGWTGPQPIVEIAREAVKNAKAIAERARHPKKKPSGEQNNGKGRIIVPG
jgi:hypothetical protein